VHVLRGDQVWESAEIAEAIAASGELWLEVPNPDDVATAQAITRELGFDQQHPLSSRLSQQELARVDAAAKSAGMAQGEALLEPMRPWLAGLVLSDAMLVHAGFDPGNGVEQLLLQEARRAKKPIRGFETFEQQLHFFADMSPRLQIEALEDALNDFDAGPAKLDALVNAWMKDDQAAITRLIVDEIKTPFPALYRTLLVSRNEVWADAIVHSLLRKAGVRLVAVGAAHLAGPDSLVVKLQKRGVKVDRVGSHP
jgi:hypothetical protein